jgi:hypothetical protein
LGEDKKTGPMIKLKYITDVLSKNESIYRMHVDLE